MFIDAWERCCPRPVDPQQRHSATSPMSPAKARRSAVLEVRPGPAVADSKTPGTIDDVAVLRCCASEPDSGRRRTRIADVRRLDV